MSKLFAGILRIDQTSSTFSSDSPVIGIKAYIFLRLTFYDCSGRNQRDYDSHRIQNSKGNLVQIQNKISIAQVIFIISLILFCPSMIDLFLIPSGD